jgi:hypothetical protein
MKPIIKPIKKKKKDEPTLTELKKTSHLPLLFI